MSARIKLKIKPPTAVSSERSSQSTEPMNNDISPKQDQEEVEQEEVLDKESQKILDSKKRHEEDVSRHKLDSVLPSKPGDDWQVAYIWAFIIKFNLRGKIARLETVEDFERCLVEPVANRPGDILENILICFLSNLKPGLRNLTCENIQSQISNYITDMLTHTSEWTVWDRGWPINEEDRASCCISFEHRLELGRLRYYGESNSARAKNNPIRQAEENGGGLFELDWRERVKLLRQMVDWQLNHSEHIRFIVNREYRHPENKSKKPPEKEAGEPNLIETVPLGVNRDRARVWSLDHSWRLYKSGNPFKRPCPMTTITNTKEEYEEWLSNVDEFVSSSAGGNGRGRPSSEQKKLAKAIKEEQVMAEKARARLPDVEKEGQRVQRAKKKVAVAVQMQQQAEIRSTRTRRQTKKVDYLYDDDGVGDGDDSGDGYAAESSTNGRHKREDGAEYDHRGKLIIPGERRSVRTSTTTNGYGGGGSGSGSSSGVHLEVPGSSSHPASISSNDNDNDGEEISDDGTAIASNVTGATNTNGGVEGDEERPKKKRKSMKGYAWVEEIVPFHLLSEKEKEKEEVIKQGQQAAAAAAASAGQEGDINDESSTRKDIIGIQNESVKTEKENEEVPHEDVGVVRVQLGDEEDDKMDMDVAE